MICLEVHVPITCFRPPLARDYQETYRLPPPSTSFGMLLSYLGVEGDAVLEFDGTLIGTAGASTDEVSRILRKMRRSTKDDQPTFRPEYQELLTNFKMWLLIDRGRAKRDLAMEMEEGIRDPSTLHRYGALSLGESDFLVNSLIEVDEAPRDVLVLRPTPSGVLGMSVWVDFVGRTNMRTRRFDLVPGKLTKCDLVEVGPTATIQ